MADIELVIRIPEVTYNFLKSVADFEGLDDFERDIANGIPLPKGHGRLIDAEELLQYGSCPDDCTGFNSPECDEVAHCSIRIFDIESINDATTIIEGEKECR